VPADKRIDVNDVLYFSICKAYYMRFEKIEAEIARREAERDVLNDAEHIELEVERQHSAAIVIVFAAMCLEAFINDYAVSGLSKSYVDKYLDKLDLATKWAIIPRLVTGKDLRRDSRAFKLLQRLVTSRHNLVHAKLSALPEGTERLVEYLQARYAEAAVEVREAYQAINALFTELGKIDPREPRLGAYSFEPTIDSLPDR
jgi:hypothetical protein